MRRDLPLSARRHRRGRPPRGPLAWPSVPAMRTRAQLFDDLVLDAIEDIESRLGRSLQPLEVAVDEVPPPRPQRWSDGVVLAELVAGDHTRQPRLVVYRRSVMSRAADPADLPHVVAHVVADQIGQWLGLDPEDLH